ncbi:MAG: hypothetical protein HZC28_15230 [Spirochaetes bacterium]|nr:hypothetical protein [Spirochaetota bacterium]
MKKAKKVITALSVLMTLLSSIYAGNYFATEFTNTADFNKWYTNKLYLGREGYINIDAAFTTEFAFNTNSGCLRTGGNIPGDADAVGAFFSEVALYTNSSFSASPVAPFGFETKVTNIAYFVGNAPQSFNQTIMQDIWLVEDKETSIENYKVAGKNFNNFGTFTHKYSAAVGTTSFTVAYIGGIEKKLNLTNAVRADGVTVTNLSLAGITERFGASPLAITGINVSYRMVHNGDKVAYYFNPNGSGGLLNEFCFLYDEPVSWSNDLRMAIGQEGKGKNGYWNAAFDAVTVRSAADVSSMAVSIDSEDQSSNSGDFRNVTFEFVNTITNTSTNAGINVIMITKSALWSNWVTNATNLFVLSDYNNDGVLETNTNVAWESYIGGRARNINPGECAVRTNTNGNELWIRLGYQVTTNTAQSTTIKVIQRVMPGVNRTGTFGFTGKVDAALFDPLINNQTINNYATCGWQSSGGGSVTLKAPTGGIGAYASLKQQSITKGPLAFTFAYYIQAFTNNPANITQIAIEIPSEMTNCAISNVDSILLGTNEPGNWRVVTNWSGGPATNASNYILITYTNAGIVFAPGGLDVIAFDVVGAPQTNTNGTSMRSWIEKSGSVPGSGFSNYQAQTNDIYANQTLIILPEGEGKAAWDYQIVDAVSITPQSLGVTNIVPMAYVRIAQDKDTNEKINGMSVMLTGNHPDVSGRLYVYRDDGDNSAFSTGYTLVTNVLFPAGTDSNYIPITPGDSNQSSNAGSPTRYWVALNVTNTNAAVFSNSFKCFIGGINASGPNGGLIDNIDKATRSNVQTTRVDTHLVYVTYTTNIAQERVKQGSFNNVQFKMILSNADPDATNYFYGMVLTNTGTASNTDIGYLKLFYDTNRNGFNASSDPAVMAGTINGSRVYTLSIYPPVMLTGTNQEIFFGAYDTELNGTVGNTVALQVLQPTNIIFFDNYNDTYSSAKPAVQGTFPLGPIPATNRLIPYTSQTFDYSLIGNTYDQLPQAFTTNQYVTVGSFSMYADTESPTTQILKGIDLVLGGKNVDTYGVAYLYKETNGNTSFSTADELIGSNFISAGANLLINSDYSNISSDQFNPNTFYLVVKLTNANITNVRTNTMTFQITNVRCTGPDNLVANISILSNTSTTARIDQNGIVTQFITNAQSTYLPRQGQFNVTYMNVGLSGVDTDATNFLTYIDVKTNGFSTITSTHLASVKLYNDVNKNGIYDSGTDSIATVGELNAQGAARLAFSSPFEIIGTNLYSFLVGFDVSSDDTNAIGKQLGFTITNGSIGVTDAINDGFAQYVFASPASGPALETNVVISSLTSRPWDFKVLNAVNNAPAAITVSNTYVMSYFVVVADGQNFITEALTNMSFYFSGKYADITGIVSLYRDTNDSTTLVTNADKLITNYSISTYGTNVISFSDNLQSSDPLEPTRYWLTLTVTNGSRNVYTNTVAFRLADLNGAGPDMNTITNKELFTNDGTNMSRVDDYQLYIFSTNFLTNSQKQGTYDALAIRLELTNADADAVYYITNMTVTNRGTASNSDMGLIQVYRDNGDRAFSGSDTVVGTASMDANKRYVITFNPPVAVNGTNSIYWISANVGFSATLTNTLAFQIPSVSSIVFSDQYNDFYNLLPTVTGSSPLPSVLSTNVIVPYVAQAFDFIITGIDYSTVPQAFTSNQLVQAATLRIAMDNDQPTIQHFLGVDVIVSNATTLSTNINGFASLYLETNDVSTFKTNEDQLLGTTAVLGGAPFQLNCSTTNITIDQANASRVYMLFVLTNNIGLCSNNTVVFQITNVRCDGPDGGIVTNKTMLTNISRKARIDGGNVIVSYILNDQVPLNPVQSSFNNRYLKLALKGDDPDSTNFVSYIDVSTNQYATNLNFDIGHIPYIKILSYPSLNMLAYSSFTNGQTRVQFTVPLAISGTNETILFVGYDVSGSENVVSNTFGLKLTNNAIGLMDGIDDNFTQYAYLSGSTSGPAVDNYVTIKSFNNNPWDFYILNGGNNFGVAPSMAVSNLYPLAFVDLIADVNEDLSAQRVTNVDVVFGGLSSNMQGELYIYRDTNNVDGFQTNDKFLGKTNFTNPNLPISVKFNENNFSGQQLTPTRLWAVLRVTNGGTTALYTNTVNGYISAIRGIGPDGPTNAVVTNVHKFTNVYYPSVVSRIDNYRVGVYASSLEADGTQVPQANFANNLKVLVLSDDPDATNFLSSISVSNFGTATAADIGAVRVFHNVDGTGIFNSTNDVGIGYANLDGTKNAVINLATPYPLGGISNTLLIGFEVKFGGTVGNTIGLRLTNTARSLTFADGYGGLFPTNAGVTNAGAASPATPSNHQIYPLAEYPFDFNLKESTNNFMPEAFTTNQKTVVEYIRIYGDITPNDDSFNGVAVHTFSTGIKSNVSGIAYLYRESTNDTLESTRFDAGDYLVGWTNVVAGQDFDIRCSIADSNTGNPTNAPINSSNTFLGDKFYVVFELTNSISLAKNDRIGFQITNLYFNGSTNKFENVETLTNYRSKVMRVDSYNVVVGVMSNDFIDSSVYVNSDKNPYIAFTLAGDDADATNYLRYVDVKRNSITADSGVATTLYLATNKISGKLGTTLASIDNNDDGVTLDLGDSPIILKGTNAVTVFVGFSVGSLDGKSVGLTIGSSNTSTNISALRFVDMINDGQTQLGFATGVTNGPLPMTNLYVVDPTKEWWDEYIYQVYAQSNGQAISNSEVALVAFDMYREGQGGGVETVYGVVVTNLTTNVPFTGYLRVYSNSTATFDFKTGAQLSTNYFISSTDSVVTVLFPANTNSIRPNADRFFVTFTPITFNDAARPQLRVCEVKCAGPDGGKVERASLLNTYPVYPIALENPAVTVSVTSLLATGSYAKQGQDKVQVMLVKVKANDSDAAFTLNGFNFSLEGTVVGTNDIALMSVFADTGVSNGVLDGSDALIPAGFSVGGDNKAKVLFETAQPISSTERSYIVSMKVHDNANIRDKVKVALHRTEQTGFAPLMIQGQAYALVLNNYSPDTTEECTILPGIIMDASAISAPTKTIFNPALGEKFSVYLKETTKAEDVGKYTLHIYTPVGHKIGEVPFTAEFKSAEWNGTMSGGGLVPSGIYLGIVTGPNGYNKKVKVLVKK